jgi:hypothetical protein
MLTLQRALVATLFLTALPAQVSGQAQPDPLDELLAIPRPGAEVPTMPLYQDIPQVADPFAGQTPTDLDAPLWDGAIGEPTPPTEHSLGLGGKALPTPAEPAPFFEFTDEVRPPLAPDNRPGMAHVDVEGPGTMSSHGQALWPGDVRTPADEPVPTLGSSAIADLLEPGSGVGANLVAATPAQLPPDALFSFQEAPAQPTLGAGPMMAVPPTATVTGYHAVGGGADQEWDASAQGLGVVRIDLTPGSGGTVLALSSDTPVFWGITAPQGARVDGVLLYGPNAAYNTIGARTHNKQRSNVVRRPDLDRAGAETLLRQGGAGAITWR